MFSSALVDLSRLQFALTSMYHFIFVPLTLGLSFLLVVMEACYITTGKDIYKDMTRFWGKLFGINFALGVATGITMEFQFGTNWAYYSHYVGDIFGSPLAVEGLMAFFMESTFIGLFFFGWNRLSRAGHFAVTFLMALGSNLSALWILVANGWMQYPVGSAFNFETMRMEMTSFWEVVSSPWAQAKFMHTVNAGYMTGSIFVLAISSWYLLKNRDILFAKRSALIAAVFGLMGTHSLSQEIKGINPLVRENEERIRNGITAVTALEELRKDRDNEMLREKFESAQHDLGYGLLLKQFTNDVSKATPEMIRVAAQSTVPTVWPMYWSFRGMVGVGMACILLFALAALYSVKGTFVDKPWLQKLCLMALPLPWIACELGWFVAEYGRQPWTIYEVLPVHLSVSALSTAEVLFSLLGFIVLYSALMVVEVWLMIRYAKLGPGSLGTGKYFSDKH